MRRRTAAVTALAPFLLLVAALAAPATQAGSGCLGPDGSVYTEGEGTMFRMDSCSFAPTILRVPVGTSVKFLNTSTVEHAVVGRASTWGSGIFSPGKEFVQTFAAAGTYPFSCPLHPGMVGAIVVAGDAPAGAPAVIGEPTPAPSDVAQTSATVQRASTDMTSVAVAALAGTGLGAALTAGAWAARRRYRMARASH